MRMMNKPPPGKPMHILRLVDILTIEQDEQLAAMLLELIQHKYGTLELEIVDGKIKLLRPKKSYDFIPSGYRLKK
jgi:hypothetical protein